MWEMEERCDRVVNLTTRFFQIVIKFQYVVSSYSIYVSVDFGLGIPNLYSFGYIVLIEKLHEFVLHRLYTVQLNIMDLIGTCTSSLGKMVIDMRLLWP